MKTWVDTAVMLGLRVEVAVGHNDGNPLVYVYYTSDTKSDMPPHIEIRINGYDDVEWLGVFDLYGNAKELYVQSHVIASEKFLEARERFEVAKRENLEDLL